MKTTLLCIGTLAMSSLASLPITADQPSGRRSPAPRAQERAAQAESAVTDALRARVVSVLTVFADRLDAARAEEELSVIFDQALAYAPLGDASLVRDIAYARRLVAHLGRVDAPQRRMLLELLQGNRELVLAFVFLVKPQDDVAAVYRILGQLHEASPRAVASFPQLAAAVCVVHDAPRRAAVSTAEDPRYIDPVAVFEFFARNAGRMLYPPQSTPAELLVYMVDTTAEPGELEWALSRHAGDRMVQKRYGDIVYDTAAFRFNRPKKIAEHPYTLENIRRVGGVCEERAHYAAHAARAIGVPAVVISGRGAAGAHAWVGVVQQRGGGPAWYMEEGRFDDYRDVRGRVTCPQTNLRVPDDQVALSGRLARTAPGDRHAATAYLDAARRIFERRSDNPSAPPHPLGGDEAEARALDSALAIACLQRAAAAAPAMPEVWLAVRDAARAKRLDSVDRQRFFDALVAALGNDHPDFFYDIVSVMVESIDSPGEQSGGWDWIVRRYSARPDLTAMALVSRGRAWHKAGDHHQAYTSYMEAVNRFGNDAPVVVTALREAERVLADGNRESHIPEMYRQGFQRIRRPSTTSASFFRQSNFYRVGHRYAELLEAAGWQSDAERIRRQIAPGADRD